jgi:hypothetical protein
MMGYKFNYVVLGVMKVKSMSIPVAKVCNGSAGSERKNICSGINKSVRFLYPVRWNTEGKVIKWS